jgi:hypothetical protein
MVRLTPLVLMGVRDIMEDLQSRVRIIFRVCRVTSMVFLAAAQSRIDIGLSDGEPHGKVQ